MSQSLITGTGLRALFEHMWWADTAVLESLDGPAAPPRAREIYAHILGAELIWIDRIEGRQQSCDVWPDGQNVDLHILAMTARTRYADFLETCSADLLTRVVQYSNSAGQQFGTRLDDILLHVALHGAYHRGQVSMILRDAGLDPAPTDYIGFARGAPAATRK